MRFRLITKDGDGLGLAWRIAQEGHEIDIYARNNGVQAAYEGILPHVPMWSKKLSPDLIFLFDMVGSGKLANSLRKTHKVYGASGLHDRLELDRNFGLSIARAYNVNLPETVHFTDFGSAIEFVRERGGRWVYKPHNNQSPLDTYIAEGPDDMAGMLDYHAGRRAVADFILQEYIDGVEVSIEGFYVDGKLVPGTLNSTIEIKRFLDGDRGPNTGCMGSVVWFWKRYKPKLYRLTLARIEPFLRQFKYTGPLDVNCIVSEKDRLPRFLEFTARFGYNAIYAALEGWGRPLADFLADCVEGQLPGFAPSHEWLAALQVSVPPYPNEAGTEISAGVPLCEPSDHIWLLDAAKRNGRFVTAGVDGAVCAVTGKAKMLDDLERSLYERVRSLNIPNMQYRSDLIEVARERINRLQEWRYF
jgi:phosphoribosylamine-glycine ligase